MAKRGPRPHPDILTPRQWEVLGLLREGLSDQQIADRLGVTLDGAKYHVSEILSKLGVSTREEAARWRPGEDRKRERLAWGALALALIAGTIAALVVLAAGTLRSGTGQEGETAHAFADLDLPPPPVAPILTMDQALELNAAAVGGDLRAVTINATTYGAAFDELFPGFEPGQPPTEEQRARVTWVFRFATVATFCGVADCPTTDPNDEDACRLGWAYVVEDDSPERYQQGGLTQFGKVLPDEACRHTEVDRSLAIVLATRAVLKQEPALQIDISGTTYGEALDAMTNADTIGSDTSADTPVWWVHFSDYWGVGPLPTLANGAPISLPGPRCDVNVLVRKDRREVVYVSSPRDSC